MKALEATTPEQFITDFQANLTDEIIRNDDPAAVLERFYTRDIVQYANGNRMDWDKLVAHTRPVRKNVTSGRIEMHRAMADGNWIGAWFTIHATFRKGRTVSTEVTLFAEFTEDGRMRQGHGMNRTVKDSGRAEADA